MFVVEIEKSNVSMLKTERIFAWAKNVYPIQFVFSPDWDGLTKLVRFSLSPKGSYKLCEHDKLAELSYVIDVTETNETLIPWELLANDNSENYMLMIAFQGKRGDEVILPSQCVSLAGILHAKLIEPYDPPAPPTPPSPDNPTSWDELIKMIDGKADNATYEDGVFSLRSGETVLSSFELSGGGSGGGGTNGKDGFSPVVEVTEIEGGHQVTITDVTGDHVFDVMDGTDGANGLSYLVIQAEFIEAPLANQPYGVERSWLNRDPVDGEQLSGVITVGNDAYYVTGHITLSTEEGTADQVLFSKIVKLNGEDGTNSGGSSLEGIQTIYGENITNKSQLKMYTAGTLRCIKTDLGFHFTDDIVNFQPSEEGVQIITGDNAIRTGVYDENGNITWSVPDTFPTTSQMNDAIAQKPATTGPVYLVINAQMNAVPEVGQEYTFYAFDFNRTPKMNEGCSGVITVGNISYYVSAIVASVGESYTLNMSKVMKLTGENGQNGSDGANGLSYLVLQAQFREIPVVGTVYGISRDWLNRDPVDGEQLSGVVTYDGISYFVVGTVTASLTTEFSKVEKLTGENGADGADGKSTYQLAVEHGFIGSEEEWLAQVKLHPYDDSVTITDEGGLSVTVPVKGIVTDAEFQALSEVERNHGFYIITEEDDSTGGSGGSSSGSSGSNVYSTEEHAVGTWLDGRPVYEKTVTGTLASKNETISTGISNADIIWLSEPSYIMEANKSSIYPVNAYFSSGHIFTSYLSTKTNTTDRIIMFSSVADIAGRFYVFTLRYVKPASNTILADPTPSTNEPGLDASVEGDMVADMTDVTDEPTVEDTPVVDVSEEITHNTEEKGDIEA